MRSFLVTAVSKIVILSYILVLLSQFKYANKINFSYKIWYYYLANFLTNWMLRNITSFEGYKFIYALLIAWMSILCNNLKFTNKNFSASITRPSSYHIKDFEIIFFAKCFSSKNEKVPSFSFFLCPYIFLRSFLVIGVRKKCVLT